MHVLRFAEATNQKFLHCLNDSTAHTRDKLVHPSELGTSQMSQWDDPLHNEIVYFHANSMLHLKPHSLPASAQ
jgi:hypothetical protein